MKKSIATGVLVFSLVYSLAAQDTLTLEECQKKALEYYPSVKQKVLIVEASNLKLKNLDVNYLPQVSINGQATYQSEVTQIKFPFPGFQGPSIDKDQYKVSLDISEIIYDGGLTGAQKKVENIASLIEQKNLETELYKVKDKVASLYFSVLLLQESKKLLLILETEIKSKLKKVESGVKNGILTETNADILKAEIMKLEQQISETENAVLAGYRMLGDYTGSVVYVSTVLKTPVISIAATDYGNSRPEQEVFALQMQKLEASKKLLDSKLMPKFAAFGQAGYGKPGLNMFSENFDTYYMLGAKLTWNIWNWNQNRNEKKILDLQSNIIGTQKETFDFGVKLLLEKNIADMTNYSEQLTKDEEIIKLREKIVAAAASQLENGVITATEYVTELNALATARLNYETHKVQLMKAQTDYLTTKGKL